MTDRDDDAGGKKEEPVATEPLTTDPMKGAGHPTPGREAGFDAEDEELDSDEEAAEERGQGFDPEQRRFLWTITAVLALAMFASAGLNIAYMDRQRARQTAMNRAADDYNVTREAFNQAQQTDIPAMVKAFQQGDASATDQAMGHLMGIYQAQQRAYAAMRHEQGLDEQVTDPTGSDFADMVRARVRQLAAQGRHPATTQSATQPGATEPAGDQPPAPGGAQTQPHLP